MGGYVREGRSPMKVPPAMKALVEVSKLNPKHGEGGQMPCPKCGSPFNYRRDMIGKLAGLCSNPKCGVRLPRA